MPDADPSDPDRTRLAERLSAARIRAFVGRQAEIELFREALGADVPPFAVLHIHGQGGVGKTALLRRLAAEATGAGRAVTLVDGRTAEPSPRGFTAALAEALRIDDDADAVARLCATPDPVVLVDTYEELTAIDGWLREQLIPRMPQRAVIVLAGREPPAAGWRADPAWADLLRVVTLRELDGNDARALLASRGIGRSRHAEILEFTRGHPLALVLVAELLDHDGAVPGSLAEVPEVIDALLERLLRHVPSDAHRAALYAAAHVGLATEALIRDTVPGGSSAELFDWLQGLSFVEPTTAGLAVHELVSDALNAQLRWRDPDAWAGLHRSVTDHLQRRLTESRGSGRTQAMLDLLRVFKVHPLTRRFYEWSPTRRLWLDPATDQDHPSIVALTRRYEGERSAAIAAYWLGRQPDAFTAFRGPETDEAAGFVGHLLFEGAPTADDLDADPVVEAVWHHIRAAAPLRSGERFGIMRFWIARDTYQDIATHHLVSARTSLDWSSTDGLAWSFVILADPDLYAPIFSFIDFHRPTGMALEADRRSFGVFARDWRTTSRRVWSDLLVDRRVTPTQPAVPARDDDRLLVLSHDDFGSAVRDALRGLARPGGLDDNPLARSRVVVERADDRPRPAVLRELLEEIVGELSGHPADEKMHRALELTYIRPAPNQEAAAERLGLPFSTFRRHLTAGVDHVAARLWDLELHGPRAGS